MGFNPVDNLKLEANKWVKITDKSGVLHFKYASSTVIYIYEGESDDVNADIPNPDLQDPVMVLNNANYTQSNKIGHSMMYKNRVGAIWAYSEGANSFVLKINRTLGA